MIDRPALDKKLKPCKFFSDAEIYQLSDAASTAELHGALTDFQVELLIQKELHNLFVPKKYNGLEKDLPDALSILEETSYLDGSLGWSLTLIAGAGLFGAFMNPEFAEQIFTANKAVIAGSGFPGGSAKLNESTYTINGKWKYATAIDHATLITATCFVQDSGNKKHSNNEKVTKAFALYPDEITVNKTWNSIGLKATGSHTFKVRQTCIPKKRTFTIAPEESHLDSPLYSYPFDAFAHATLAVSLLGMANRFLDEAKHILHQNEVPSNSKSFDSSQTILKKCYQEFHQAKEALYQAVHSSWATLNKDGVLQQAHTNQICKQSRHSSQKAINSVQTLYPFLGMAVIQPDTFINRCWRDIHTASQHMLLRPQPASSSK